MKDFKSGMCLGKFLPQHLGHNFLVQSGIDACDKFTVLVCSLEREPIPGILRYEWMKQTFPNANVIHVSEELPQYPHEHPDFWSIWIDVLKRYCPADLDVIFASEDYGKTLGDFLGIRHVIVDKERKTIPISGTAIREKPLTNWNYIADVAKPYFVKKFVVVGPESVGKTELCKKLAKYYDTCWVPEYGRELFEKKKGKLDLVDFTTIAIQQIKYEEKLCKVAKKILICDTDTITTYLFSKMYFPNEAKDLEEFFQNKISKNSTNYCQYILLDTSVLAVQDGTRVFLKERQDHFDTIKNELDKRNLPYIIVSGDYSQRFQKSVDNINSCLSKF